MKAATLSAPGKMLLAGEYAVLEGAPALVSAVSRRVSVRGGHSERALPPEVAATLALAPGDATQLVLDTSALYQGERKLGLGSSAAAAVAAAGWCLETAGAEFNAQRCFDLALAGHHAVAPLGSGTDVAAAAFGGVLRCDRLEDGLAVQAAPWPEGLAVRVLWSGVPMRTSDMLTRLKAFRTQHRALAEASLDALAQSATQCAEAWFAGAPGPVLEALWGFGERLDALGQEAEMPIYSEALRTLSREIGAHGVVKPSGAGGGDVALVFYRPDYDPGALLARAQELGLTPLDLDFAAEGVRLEPAAAETR